MCKNKLLQVCVYVCRCVCVKKQTTAGVCVSVQVCMCKNKLLQVCVYACRCVCERQTAAGVCMRAGVCEKQTTAGVCVCEVCVQVCVWYACVWLRTEARV